MNSLANLLNKTLRYLRNNGLLATVKKVFRRVQGNNWLPMEEDKLYLQPPCQIPPFERWEMPEVCLPFTGSVSVVIPAYNGAHELPALLAALGQQSYIPHLEVVVVDSGSTDGTPELAAAAGAVVLSIRQEDFSHSYARMLGATKATGDYLLFMTQDALPDRSDWIIRLLQPCLVSGAAAVSCYETPKPEADLLSHITVWNWKQVMSGGIDRLTRLPQNAGYDALRRNAQLSDNACLVKRSVFMELGGHRGAYAEDLDLGIRLLKAGYSLGILSSVSVVHSHNRPPEYHFKRAIVDGVNIAKLFDDFTLDQIAVPQAFNRLFTAAASNRLYRNRLAASPWSSISPADFAQWTRTEYNQCILEVKAMSPSDLKTLLFAPGDDLDPSARSFLEVLWQDYAADYQFDGGLAALQGRYILHTLCPYLEQSHLQVNLSLKAEICHLIWQYFGQSAGYVVAAAYLTPHAHDLRIDKTVQQYSVGV